MKRVVSIAALVATLAPAIAGACPQCAGRSDGGLLGAVVLGVMILSPFIVALLAFPIIRRFDGSMDVRALQRGQQEDIG